MNKYTIACQLECSLFRKRKTKLNVQHTVSAHFNDTHSYYLFLYPQQIHKLSAVISSFRHIKVTVVYGHVHAQFEIYLGQ